MSSAVRLVARREIVTRWQQKGYRIGLGVTLLLAIVAVVVPALFADNGGWPSYDIGLVGSHPSFVAGLRTEAQLHGVRLTLHGSDERAGRAKVDDGDWDAVVLANGQLVVETAGDGVVAFAQDALVLGDVLSVARQAGDIDRYTQLSVAPLSVQALKSGDDTQRQTLSIVTIIVLFSQLITFSTWVATGVVEEKSSRVVELILSSVRPIQLLAGKLLGIGTLAAAQVAVLGGAALTASTAAGTLTLPASDLVTVLISFVAFVLGFAFFAAIAAGLASTVSRQEEVSGVLAPVTVVIMICYFAAFTVSSGDPSTLGRVLSIVPPVSCIAMPAALARGTGSALGVVLAIVLLLAATLAALALAAKIYRVSVLHSGTRLTLRRAWRGEEVAARTR